MATRPIEIIKPLMAGCDYFPSPFNYICIWRILPRADNDSKKKCQKKIPTLRPIFH